MQHPQDTPNPLPIAPIQSIGCSSWQLPSPESARQAFLGATEPNITAPLIKSLQVGSKCGTGMYVPGKEARFLGEKKCPSDYTSLKDQAAASP